MLDVGTIANIARKAATKHLEKGSVERVESEPATDSDGNDALRITLVLKPHTADTLDGDSVLDTLVAIQRELREAGEDRFPIVEYATQEELEADADPQP